MIPFPLSFAVSAVSGTYHGDAALLSATVTDVTIDSRKAGEGILYVPIIGQVHDGPKFIGGAMAPGALCTALV